MTEEKDDRGEEIWEEEKLMEVLSSKAKVDLEVEKRLGKLEEDFTLLFLTGPEKLSDARLSLLRLFAKKKLQKGIIVSVALSGQKLSKHLSENKIDSKNISIIDASGSKEKQANTVYVDDPSELNELLSEIETQLSGMKEKSCFLLFDSITTLLIYNDEKTIERFFHSLVPKISEYKIKAIFLGIKTREASNMLRAIGNFCDQTEHF